MVADKKKRLVQRYFFQVGIENPSEKGSESEWGYYELQESAEHQSIFSLKNNVHFHLSRPASYIKKQFLPTGPAI